jgi:hypothetical protein
VVTRLARTLATSGHSARIELAGTTARVQVPLSGKTLEGTQALVVRNQSGRVFLRLDDIRSDRATGVYYEVYINPIAGEKPDTHAPSYLGNLSLFGLTPHANRSWRLHIRAGITPELWRPTTAARTACHPGDIVFTGGMQSDFDRFGAGDPPLGVQRSRSDQSSADWCGNCVREPRLRAGSNRRFSMPSPPRVSCLRPPAPSVPCGSRELERFLDPCRRPSKAGGFLPSTLLRLHWTWSKLGRRRHE